MRIPDAAEITVINQYRRGVITHEELINWFKDQGWSDDELSTLDV